MRYSLLAGLAAITVAFTPVASAQARDLPVNKDDTAPAPTVYYPFPVGAMGQWRDLTVSPDPSRWRVGRPDGPVATREQLAAVLAQPRLIAIGVFGEQARTGRTAYPYGFELDTSAGGKSDNKFPAGRDLLPTSREQLTRFDDRGQPASRVVWSTGDSDFAGALTPVLNGLLGDNFLGWLSVSQGGSDQGLTPEGNAVLRLRFRVVTNSQSGTPPRQLKGVLVLSSRDLGPNPAGQAPSRPAADLRDRT